MVDENRFETLSMSSLASTLALMVKVSVYGRLNFTLIVPCVPVVLVDESK